MSAIKPLKRLNCKDLLTYLKSLPNNLHADIYKNPATCLAVFRSLPDVAKHYVMRLLFVEAPVSQDVIKHWVVKEHTHMHDEAVISLTELNIWEDCSIPGGLPGWKLKASFRQNFKIVMLGGGVPWSCGIALEPDKNAKDSFSLHKYALERWECVLHYLVGSPEAKDMLTADIIKLIEYSGLMTNVDNSTYITPAGFQFLLMDTSQQVWFLVLQYLETVEDRNMSLQETLTLLFEISFATFEKEYSAEKFSDGQQRFLQHLRELGLVYQRKRKLQRFYPTKLVINLAKCNAEEDEIFLADQGVKKLSNGFIVVETNYKIYAYTSSTLHIALLALFCDILCRFPEMCVANLSRESVRRALTHGITAQQIIDYLRTHCHDIMLKNKPSILPPTITDQIRIWELERDRLSYDQGVLYSQFLSQSDFDTLKDHAEEKDVLIWCNQKKRMMVVSIQGHEDVRRFWKRRRQVVD